eukprot:TRINITY_DN6420_c1_g1_i2.p1 TRINITY_DN6420_c1_g1~~TRINITY_DN6420_c1_g1_i2.p1  ORF type:complete len:124 (-),score=17.22 TRINITY_DN6420_c1_g1_i2:1174-1545(-)
MTDAFHSVHVDGLHFSLSDANVLYTSFRHFMGHSLKICTRKDVYHLIIRQLQLLCHEEHFPIVSQWRVQAHVFSNFFIVNHVHPETIAHEKLVQPFLHLHLGSKLHLCDSGWQFTNKNAPFCS